MSDSSSLDYLFDLDSLLEDTANECELIDRNNARKEREFSIKRAVIQRKVEEKKAELTKKEFEAQEAAAEHEYINGLIDALEPCELVTEKKCAVCEITGLGLGCSVCKSVYYCSVEHQTEHWKKHKKACKVMKAKLKRTPADMKLAIKCFLKDKSECMRLYGNINEWDASNIFNPVELIWGMRIQNKMGTSARNRFGEPVGPGTGNDPFLSNCKLNKE